MFGMFTKKLAFSSTLYICRFLSKSVLSILHVELWVVMLIWVKFHHVSDTLILSLIVRYTWWYVFVAISSVLKKVEIIEDAKECFSQDDTLLEILSGISFPDLSSLPWTLVNGCSLQIQKSPGQAGPRGKTAVGHWAFRQQFSSVLLFHFFVCACFIFLLLSVGWFHYRLSPHGGEHRHTW